MPIDGTDQRDTINLVSSQSKDPLIHRSGKTFAADTDFKPGAGKRREFGIEANFQMGPFKLLINALPDYLLSQQQRQRIDLFVMPRDGDAGGLSVIVSDDSD